LRGLLSDQTGGDPEGRRKYVRPSLRALAAKVKSVSHMTVRRLLKQLGYSLRANVKRLSGPPHPDRDRQFRYLRRKERAFLKAGQPVISADAKNSELIGNFKNDGSLWCAKADEVSAYDFPSEAQCRATPYGVYDLATGHGHVNVGTSSNTGEFSVQSIRAWWQKQGRRYPHATRLLVKVDGGGSNGWRPRLWKREVQRFADESGLEITVCHYPRGASKWNDVEHRLFGPISINWSGQPLRSLDLMLKAIRGTTNATGLKVTARLDRRRYATKIKVSDREMKELNIKRHKTCPNWNYTINPRTNPGK
jgi:Rhodopirellula transposase DDE domain